MLDDLLKESPLCYVLANKVQTYFQDAEHQRAFEEWFEKKYGRKYEWKADTHDKQKGRK